MPEQPLSVRNQLSSESQKNETSEEKQALNIDDRVQKAITAVQSDQPMAGIQDLLSIVREDSTQIDAQYYLGLFSIRTQQFEKAVNRFEKVIKFAGLKKYPDTRYNLAVSLEGLGDKAGAINQLEQYLGDINPAEEDQLNAVREEIERLRN